MLFQFYPCFNFIIDNFYTRNIFPWNLQLLERVTAFLNRKIALNNDINYLSKTRSKTSNADDEQMIDQIFLQRTETSNGLDNNNNNNNNNIIYIYKTFNFYGLSNDNEYDKMLLCFCQKGLLTWIYTIFRDLLLISLHFVSN